LAGKCIIVDYDHPGEVNVNEEVSWYVVGEVRDGVVRNPGVGLYYKDGPADKIIIVEKDGKKVEVPKDYARIYYFKGDRDPGTRIDSRNAFRGVIYPEAGTYTIWLVSGYVSEDEAAMGLPIGYGCYVLSTKHVVPLSHVQLTFKTFEVGPEGIATVLGALSPLILVGAILGYNEAVKKVGYR